MKKINPFTLFSSETLPLTARQKKAQELRSQAEGREYAPAQPGTPFAETRKKLVEKFVQKGLKEYDAQQGLLKDEEQWLNDEQQGLNDEQPGLKC